MRCKTSKKPLEHRTPLTFLVRVPEKNGGVLSWVDEYLTAEPTRRQMVSFSITDEVKLKRLLSKKPTTTGEWEVDTFFAPVPIGERGRPYFPKMCLVLDHRRSLVLSFEMVEDIRTEGHRFVSTLVSLIERGGQIPERLLVARAETYVLFSQVCTQLGIGLERVPRLENTEHARSEMIDYFNGSQFSR